MWLVRLMWFHSSLIVCIIDVVLTRSSAVCLAEVVDVASFDSGTAGVVGGVLCCVSRCYLAIFWLYYV